jgi:hypothetical protein
MCEDYRVKATANRYNTIVECTVNTQRAGTPTVGLHFKESLDWSGPHLVEIRPGEPTV